MSNHILKAGLVSAAMLVFPSAALAATSPLPTPAKGAKLQLVGAGLTTPTSFAFGAGHVFVSDGTLPTGGGVILNWSSIGGMNASTMPTSVYSAAKAGVISFTKAAAVEYADAGIRANVICPGFVETEMSGGPGAAKRFPALQGFLEVRAGRQARLLHRFTGSHVAGVGPRGGRRLPKYRADAVGNNGGRAMDGAARALFDQRTAVVGQEDDQIGVEHAL